MERNTPTHISLTGENSHKIVIPPGQGSFSIGTKNVSKGKYDVLVTADSIINWEVFNEMYTPHGKQNTDRYPYGDWPRFFYYSGDDSGFIRWSEKRRIESLNWSPISSLKADFTKANIDALTIHVGDNPIELILGENILKLHLNGNITNITIKASPGTTLVHFSPDAGADTIYGLPQFPSLSNIATSIHLDNVVVGTAFDCASLLQFKKMSNLNLRGNITNLQALVQLQNLEYLGLRTIPDLTGVPTLSTWSKLKSFIGWNIEETKGKILQQELKALLKEKEMEYSSVSKLRKKTWFTTEYGIPFTDWDGNNAKTATKAYKLALKEINKAKTEEEVKLAIIKLVQLINTLPNIETVEREDTGTAVEQLVASSKLNLSQELAVQWFDEVRDF